MLPSLTVIDLVQHMQGVNEYKNISLSGINDHVVKLSVMIAPYIWHYHPNSDETFYVIEGILCVDLDNATFELAPGQMFTIPANVRHCTRPKGNRSVNLTFERKDIETIEL